VTFMISGKYFSACLRSAGAKYTVFTKSSFIGRRIGGSSKVRMGLFHMNKDGNEINEEGPQNLRPIEYLLWMSLVNHRSFKNIFVFCSILK